MKLLVISSQKSDLYEVFCSVAEVRLVSPSATEVADLFSFDAAAVLGGTEEKPLILNAYLRQQLEAFADTGKPLFLEYVGSFRWVYSATPATMAPHRLVACADAIGGIAAGDLLDSRCNRYIRPHYRMPNTEVLLTYRQYTPAHDHTVPSEEGDEVALFRYDNVLTAAFCLCHFVKACFAPMARWQALVGYICEFLGLPRPTRFPLPTTAPNGADGQPLEQAVDGCISRALALLERYLVKEDGSAGIREGLSHHILPDGRRCTADMIRTDCTGEAAGAFLFSGDADKKAVAERMYALCFGPLMIHGGEFDGMIRWSEEAWGVCYQDDVARAMIGLLLYAYFGGEVPFVEDACRGLRFLSGITCKDGLLPYRTDVLEFVKSGEAVRSIAQKDEGLRSGHYNSWYCAALLLGYLVSGDETLRETGVRGMETLMSVYPETVREHSETSELCRLIFPLAVLVRVTGERRHTEMLERVFADLQSHRHPNGGYAEWDTGYRATRFNTADSECSLLSANGDPVADLLYSLNWLPLGFAFAWHATGDERFGAAWEDIAAFLTQTQLISENPLLDGAWCRGIDLDRREYVGIPHDVGWGPCCVETGWTVAEIATGLLIGRRLSDGTLPIAK